MRRCHLRIRIKFGCGPHPRKENVTLTVAGPHYFEANDVVILDGYRYIVTEVLDATKLRLRRLWPHDYVWLLAKLLFKQICNTLRRAWKGAIRLWNSTTRRWRRGPRLIGS